MWEGRSRGGEQSDRRHRLPSPSPQLDQGTLGVVVRRDDLGEGQPGDSGGA